MKTTKEITFTMNEAEAKELLGMMKGDKDQYRLHDLRVALKKFLGEQ